VPVSQLSNSERVELQRLLAPPMAGVVIESLNCLNWPEVRFGSTKLSCWPV
jgi:hypothetical protein